MSHVPNSRVPLSKECSCFTGDRAASQAVLDEDLQAHSPWTVEYVPVIFAGDVALALRIQAALEARDIPSLVELEGRDPAGLGLLCRRVPVLVPEELHDAASEIAARVEHMDLAASGDEEEDEEVFDDDEEEFEDNGFDDTEEDEDDFDDEDESDDL